MQYEERYDTDKLRFLNSLDQTKYTKLIHKESTSKKDIKANYETFKKFVNECLKGNGVVRPIYSQNLMRGRYYARGSSIQPLSKYVRGFLCSDISTDIDIKNCYPVILKYICDKNKIMCPNLTYYVDHRETIFHIYKSESEEIKKQIFTIMFGGKFTSKNEFVQKFKKEYTFIQEKLSVIEDYKEYYDNFEKDKKNKEGGATFKIIEDIEIKVVSKAIEFLKSKGIEILAYMYDGCMIYGDQYQNINLINSLNEEITKSFKDLKIEFVYKKHIDELKNEFEKLDPDEFEEIEFEKNGYTEEKDKFEKFCAKIIDKAVYIVEKYKNGMVYEINTFSESKLNISYKHLHFTIVDDRGKCKKIQFLPIWEKDENMRMYESMDVYPPGTEVPPGHYNLWTPFDSEYTKKYTENKEALKLILNHIKIICGNEESIYDYFIKWMAYVIQFPSKKSICPVFVSKEGAGKGTMFNLFRKMLGTNKIIETTSPERDVWGDFNGQMMSSYLVGINEVGKRQQNESIGKIKGLVTDHELTINQKGQPQIKIISYHKFIITTNNEDPVYTDDNDRRFFVVRSSDEKIQDMEYFRKINEYLENPDVIKTCYEYFKNVPDVKDFPFIKKPVSMFHQNLKELNKPVIVQFLEFICYLHLDKEEVKYDSQNLYKDFVIWTNDNGIKYETSSFKLMCSIRNLNLSGINKKRDDIKRFTIFNIKQLKKDLKL